MESTTVAAVWLWVHAYLFIFFSPKSLALIIIAKVTSCKSRNKINTADFQPITGSVDKCQAGSATAY